MPLFQSADSALSLVVYPSTRGAHRPGGVVRGEATVRVELDAKGRTKVARVKARLCVEQMTSYFRHGNNNKNGEL